MRSAPKKKGNVSQRVWEMCGPLAQELGLSLWDVQFVKEGADWFLRVFIDKEGGVSIDDCVDMTHALSPCWTGRTPFPRSTCWRSLPPGWSAGSPGQSILRLCGPSGAGPAHPPPGKRPA